MDTFDFLIIGGGIAGASAAYELAAHGSVALLERESQPGAHATGRSAALYSQTYGNAVIRALSIGSWGFYDAPPRGFADHPLLSPRGTMFVGNASQVGDLDRILDETAHLVAGIAKLSAAEACARVPVLRPEKVFGAVLEAHAMDIDVHALHQGFLRGFRHRGGRVVTDAEVLRLAHDHVWRIETGAGTFAAETIVNAAGAWCDAVAAMAGARPVGLQPRRRTAITFAAPPGFDIATWPLTVGAAEDFYFKPDAGRLLGSPADETPVEACDAQPEEWDVAVAVDRIEAATTMTIRRIEHKWAGLRTFAADRTPVVGFDAETAGFFWIAGQGGYGIQTAPAMARIAAALATGSSIPSDLQDRGVSAAMLSPARFLTAASSG